MRNLKKVLVLVLALAMMLSLMVMGAGAAFTDQSEVDSKHTEAVDMAVALNIINGYPDGSFKPNGNVTREEMAKMICVLDNGGKEPQLATGNTFSDVAADRWSNKYIEACAARGVVAGVGNGMFNPSGNVTATQAARMLLVELGYDEGEQNYTGPSWATNVNVDATKKGYYEDLEDIDVTAPLTREHAAQMIWNALQQAEITYTYSANGAKVMATDKLRTIAGTEQEYTLLWDKYNGDTCEGILESFTYDSKNAKWSYVVTDTDSGLMFEKKSTTDFTDMLGMNVKMVYDITDARTSGDAYGVFASDSKVLFSGRIADLPSLNNTADSIKFNGETYRIEQTDITRTPVEFFLYGRDVTLFANQTTLDVVAGKIGGANITAWDPYSFVAIDNDDDGKIDLFRISPFVAAKITYAVGKDIKLSATDYNGTGQAITWMWPALATTTDKLEVGYDVTAYDGIAKNDYGKWIPAMFTKDNTDVVTKAEVFSGKVTMNDDPDFTVNGTTYTADDSFTAPLVGSILTDVVVIDGFAYDVDSTKRKEVKDYAVITAIAPTGLSVDGDRAKLLFNDNTQKVVDTDKDYFTTEGFRAGDLVTYKTTSDGYKLTAASTNTGIHNAALAGYDMWGDDNDPFDVNVKAKSNSSTDVGFISGECVDGYVNGNLTDTSVIFVQYMDGLTMKWKAITGTALKRVAMGDFDDTFANRYLLGTKVSQNSNNYDVDLAYLSTGGNNLSDADTFFGYVLSAVTIENANGDNVQQIKMLTKDGEQELVTADETVPAVAMRMAVEYKVNSSGEISDVEFAVPVDRAAYTNATATTSGYSTAGITKWGSVIEFKELMPGEEVTETWTDSSVWKGLKEYYFETDSDTVILYIENSSHAKADTTSISNADDATGFLSDGFTPVPAGSLDPNAFLAWDDEGTLKLVIYDVENDIIR